VSAAHGRWTRGVTTVVLTGLAVMSGGVPAYAQATRTWVSGVGDNANPCSRSAPCLTLAGALSKTATGGEIDVLGALDLGPATIGKAITVDGDAGFGRVVATGADGLVISVPAAARVILRGLSIEGNGSGTNGIRFITGAALIVDDTTIGGFSNHGIDFEPAAAAELVLTNVDIRDNAASGVFARGGALLPVAITGSRVVNNAIGINARSNTRVSVRDNVIANNSSVGLLAQPDSGTTEMDVGSSLVAHNGVGVRANGQSTLRLSDSTIEGNSLGVQVLGGATLLSFANNRVAGNNETPTPTPMPTSTPVPVPTSTPVPSSGGGSGNPPSKPAPPAPVPIDEGPAVGGPAFVPAPAPAPPAPAPSALVESGSATGPANAASAPGVISFQVADAPDHVAQAEVRLDPNVLASVPPSTQLRLVDAQPTDLTTVDQAHWAAVSPSPWRGQSA
jgi:hypothetical protein